MLGREQLRREEEVTEAVLLCPHPLPASSPFPNLGSQTSNLGAKFSYRCVVFGPGMVLLGRFYIKFQMSRLF